MRRWGHSFPCGVWLGHGGCCLKAFCLDRLPLPWSGLLLSVPISFSKLLASPGPSLGSIECQASLHLGVAGIYLLTIPQGFTPEHSVLHRARGMLPHLWERGKTMWNHLPTSSIHSFVKMNLKSCCICVCCEVSTIGIVYSPVCCGCSMCTDLVRGEISILKSFF